MRLVGIDIGRNNMALASVLCKHPSVCPARTKADLNMHWDGQSVQTINLKLGGGPATPLTDTLPVLHKRLFQTGWSHTIRDADLIVIEQQNGNMAPHNFALQAAMHMFCLAHVLPEKIVIASNLRKLTRMANYGFTQPRQKGARRNKKDVVEWTNAEVDAGRLHADWTCAELKQARKTDDVADALTHALAVWWETRETRELRSALKLRKPANPYSIATLDGMAASVQLFDSML